MAKKGRMVYVPPNVIEEAESIMNSKELKTRSQAFDEMVKYCKVGKEAERILKFDWDLFKKKRGRK